MTRVVTTHYRYKPPPKKRKAVALPTGRIVRRVKPVDPSHDTRGPTEEMSKPATPAPDDQSYRLHGGASNPANDDHQRTSSPDGTKLKEAAAAGPALVTAASKRSTRPPSEPQAATSADDPPKPVIVTSISRKRARQRSAGYTPAEPGDGPHRPDEQTPASTSTSEALMKAMARMMRPPGAG